MRTDFGLEEAFKKRKGRGLVDLGDYAARRGVANRSVGLQKLFQLLTKKRLLKDREALFSNWNTSQPSSDQLR